MKQRNQETPSAGPTSAATGTGNKAEKVQSSRYEWEGRTGEPESPAPKANAARGTFLRTFGAWLKKLFATDFFDKDDDATPSAA